MRPAEALTGTVECSQETGSEPDPRLPWPARVLAAAGAAGLLMLLLVARLLTPEPSGFGTHQQLGLPPCTWIAFWGIPCPTCGMTTSWSHLLRGEVGESLKANPAGSLIAVMTAVLAVGLGWSALRGKWSVLVRAGRTWSAAVIGLAVVMLVFWLGRLTGWI